MCVNHAPAREVEVQKVKNVFDLSEHKQKLINYAWKEDKQIKLFVQAPFINFNEIT